MQDRRHEDVSGGMKAIPMLPLRVGKCHPSTDSSSPALQVRLPSIASALNATGNPAGKSTHPACFLGKPTTAKSGAGGETPGPGAARLPIACERTPAACPASGSGVESSRSTAASVMEGTSPPVSLREPVPPAAEQPRSHLATRRTRMIERVMTEREQKDCVDRVPEKGSRSPQAVKRIKMVQDMCELYKLGGVVMPSCHQGMEVLFATCRQTGKDVVVKVRKKDASFANNDSEQEWRMSTEFVLNMPACDGVAAIYEVLETDAAYYIVMEKVQGRDLFEALSANEVCDLAEVKEVMRQLLSALDVMHQRGAIHRDLKLENVMFMKINDELLPCSRDDEEPASPVVVKLIDFDTVQTYDPKGERRRSHELAGTDQYIPQEAYDGCYSPASDVFAVGVMGYKILTGRFPFSSRVFDDGGDGDNKVGSPGVQRVRRRIQGYRISFQHRAFTEDPQARNLIRWMLSTDETRRPSAAAALEHPWLSGHIGGDVRASRRSATLSPSIREVQAQAEASSPASPASGGPVSEDVGSPKRKDRHCRTSFSLKKALHL